MRILFFTIMILFSVQFSNAAIKDSIGVQIKDGKKYIVHEVEAKQTLFAISQKYKVSVTDIKLWNNMTDNALALGQKILILSKNQSATPGKTHTVQASETLYSISKKYNVTVAQLTKWNNLQSNSLSIGQKIIVSEGVSNTSETLVVKKETPNKHTVAKGETLYSIAKAHKTSVDNLKKLNKLKDNSLEIGQVLILKEGAGATAKTTKSKENEFINESGQAQLLTLDDFQEKYAYCFHQTAPKGTIIKVTNTESGKFMYVRVMGKSGQDLIQVNRTVMDKIGSKDNTFSAQLSYYL